VLDTCEPVLMMRLHSLTSCISWSIHTSVPMSDVRSITQLPICVQMCHCVCLCCCCSCCCSALAASAALCCRLSKIVALAAAGWSAFCTGSNLRPALLAHWWSLLSCLMLDWMRSRRAPHTAISSRAVTALLRIGCIPEHSPSVVPLYSPRHQIKTSIIYASVRGEKSSSAGTENQAASSVSGSAGGEVRNFLHCQLTHR
jgi:hypothetical protein